MWLLLFTSGISVAMYSLYRFYKMFSIDKSVLFTPDAPIQREKDEYNLICYRVIFEDTTRKEEVHSEITKEELDEIDEYNKIRFVIIEYMYNGRLCKQLVYNKQVEFPIYQFAIQNTEWEYYPEYFWFGEKNISDYVRPYLGPSYNFYMDTDQVHFLKDILYDHPDIDTFDFENDKLYMITNDTPITGVKLLIKDPMKQLLFKRHAAVDPRDLDKLGLKLNQYQEIVRIDNNKKII